MSDTKQSVHEEIRQELGFVGMPDGEEETETLAKAFIAARLRLAQTRKLAEAARALDTNTIKTVSDRDGVWNAIRIEAIDALRSALVEFDKP